MPDHHKDFPGRKQIRRDMWAEAEKPVRCPLCEREMVFRHKRGKRHKPPNNLATLDHIVSQAQGGSDDKGNLRLICARCNVGKGDLTESEYEAKKAANDEAVPGLGQASPAIQTQVALAIRMCEAIGLDPYERQLDDDEIDPERTLNWQFLLPAASTAFYAFRPVAGDLLAIPDPHGFGFLMRIDSEGVLHMRANIAPGTPLLTVRDRNTEDKFTVITGDPPPPETSGGPLDPLHRRS